MKNETPAGRGLENLAGRLVLEVDSTVIDAISAVIERRLDPSDLGLVLWQLWEDGFNTGVSRMRPKLEAAESAADHWYLRARYSTAEIREMQMKAMDDGWRAYWDAGMPTEVAA